MTCGAVHPEQPGVTCLAKRSHDQHFAMHAGTPVEWPNADWVEPPPRTRSSKGKAAERLKDLADQVPARQTAVARHTDPATSHIAAVSVGDLRPHQRVVLGVLMAAPEPLTDEEVYERLTEPMSVSGARTRRAELVDSGMVEDSGLRGKTVNGRPSIKWRVRPGV